MAKIMRLTALFFRNKYTERAVAVLTIFLFLATVSVALRSYYLYQTLFPAYEQKLNKKLKDQVAIIKAFLLENKKHVDELALDPVILDFLQNISPESEKALNNYISKRKENFGFKSLSLIANSGIVVFSTNELLRDVHLNDEKYSQTPLFRSFFVSSMTLTPDFSDFSYSTIIKAPAFYITMPLIKNNKILGVIAYQIDEENLNTITKDYLDLGRTGEFVLAVQTGSRATFITPTRNDPKIRFTTKELFSDTGGYEALLRAGRGETGFGENNDYQGIKTLASWSFIPGVDWAIIVKINIQEILEPIEKLNKYLITLSILTLLSALLTLFFYYQNITKRLAKIQRRLFRILPAQLRYPEFFLLIIFLFLSIFSINQYKSAMSSSLEKAQKFAIKQIQNGISEVNNNLNKITNLADFIAQDLRTERLISEDIRKRLRREIVETEGLVRITIAYGPYRYDSKIKLHAPSIPKKKMAI